MKKAAYFADHMNSENSSELNFSIIGGNTGNEAFITALSRLISVDRLPRRALAGDAADLSRYESFITSDLIWIRQNTDAPESITLLLDRFPEKRIVPISMGLQASEYLNDFVLSDNMVRTLERISERASIAVRGSYTAEILSKYGIRNLDIVGCPSVYQFPLYQNSCSQLFEPLEVEKAAANFRTFYERLSESEISILRYFSRYFDGFVEQTALSFSRMDGADRLEGELEDVKTWMEQRTDVFFDIEDWISYYRRFHFSMGSRFHGNVIAMLAGVRALFVVTDTRTNELTDFFEVPSMRITDFDASLPLQAYFERADYACFRSGFHNKVSSFGVYLRKNGLEISADYEAALERFDFQRLGRPWLTAPGAS